MAATIKMTNLMEAKHIAAKAMAAKHTSAKSIVANENFG